ncbi:CPBP family intramembrane glutamic endopeptidase [Francisella adeliensis]|uniref:CPBP family intramembrane metalloprotease n=1 Tax=Francisella adeliensis TaxID=2007306 RepID=A0A2Z4XXV7_9GAMM|nr:type II CAAX endopeptidase family protein [Francisella adeliensis]AXA33570.1 CPBP family intramembrane metalloprotease [Francisella adeliensis]MBK2084723.1 CPBP family intramembrane metalloprotease [Francisella adeliensis]MBK2097334.1 CPBP family intramembrane metalloprotease [Francisella adeliensis]QIW11802.1 CPBP family intramembrane metalloprotease [Francisella adeliensis]QIW13678.1 CPBP family intramembrane metalloprotease [Francisella adeliensis]
MSTKLNIIKTFFVINVLFSITSCIYYQNELFGSLAIFFSALSLTLSILIEKRIFNSSLFLFLSTLPIYLIIPLYQNPMFATLVIALVISVLIYGKQVFRLFSFGKVKDVRIWFAIAFVAVIASSSLVLWGLWADNLGVGAPTITELKRHSTILLLLVIPLITLLNAIVEEIVFRGILQTELSDIFGISVAIFLQAFLFAGFHYAGGFPNGLIGFGMTFVYAGALGVMRHKVKGLLAPIITHWLADLTIVIFLWVCF